MCPPLWGEGLTCCVLSEGEQRSTELSTQFYATQIFPGCTPSISNKIKHLSEHETYCAAQDNYWSCKTVKDHCDIHLILALYICVHLDGQWNFVPNILICSFTDLGLCAITQKSNGRHRKTDIGQEKTQECYDTLKARKGGGFYSCFQRASPPSKKVLNIMWHL